MPFLKAEPTLEPTVKKLTEGDRIEVTMELDIFPLTAESYYGSNQALRERLAESPDSWELTAYEAQEQGLQINGKPQVFPTVFEIDSRAKSQSFTVESRSPMDVICIAGLSQPGTWQLSEQLDVESLELGDRFSVERDPQVNYDPATQTWTVVLSLVFPEGATKRSFVVKQL